MIHNVFSTIDNENSLKSRAKPATASDLKRLNLLLLLMLIIVITTFGTIVISCRLQEGHDGIGQHHVDDAVLGSHAEQRLHDHQRAPRDGGAPTIELKGNPRRETQEIRDCPPWCCRPADAVSQHG